TFVYAQPNGSAAKIGVPAGLRVMVTEVNGGWAKVRNGAYYAFMAVTDLSTPEAYQAAVQVKPIEPTNGKRLEGIVIGIDPGHQAHADNGQEPIAPGSIETKDRVASGTAGVVTRVNEYEVDLNISLQLRDALIAQGATVVMTRQTNDVNISNMERALLMNGSGVNLVLRLHCNGSSNHDDNGIGLYVTKTGGIADASYMAAEKILPYMTAATGARRDGIFKRDSYTGLNWSTVPAILVEMGYMSNPAEDMKLNDPAYQAQLVNGMVEGICACFGR
ncbi:MAG: N-acetylmuramoyl-L-alanine amidase, partial [Clostridia bacterium]|nr:N-acetylmuramoyl-L-alanine amidase [Clostridia bacterium]